MRILSTFTAHIALFLLTYSAGVAYLWHTDRSGSLVDMLEEGLLRSEGTTGASSTGGVTGRYVPAAESVRGHRSEERKAIAEDMVSSRPDSAGTMSSGDGLSEETRAEVTRLSDQAVSGGSLQQRRQAIVKLRNAARTPESVHALVTALATDEAAQNRLFAITALRTLGMRGDEDGSIRNALSRAINDADPRVSSRASEALNAVSQAMGLPGQ